MEALPEGVALRALRGADAIAYLAPSLADVAVSVWRPRGK
jgi:hypothetical protein